MAIYGNDIVSCMYEQIDCSSITTGGKGQTNMFIISFTCLDIAHSVGTSCFIKWFF